MSRSTAILVLLTFGLFFTWISHAKLQQVVRGDGQVIPQQKTQQIQHLEGGIVEEILVSEGEKVKKGQPLFRIHDLKADGELGSSHIQGLSLDLKLFRLAEEAAGKRTLTFPKALIDDEGMSKVDVQDILAREKKVFSTRWREFDQQYKVLSEQIQQKRRGIDKLKKQQETLGDEVHISQRQMEINLRLRQKGAISESKLLASQGELNALKTRLSQATLQIPVVQSELAEVQQQQQQLKNKRQREIADEASDLQTEKARLNELTKSLTDRVSRSVVTAPTAGIINRLAVNTVGGVIQPGATLADVTPTAGTSLIQGRVRTQDRGRIWLGQKVRVRVSAYDFSHFGALDGTLTYISSDSLSDGRTAPFYQVRIQLEAPKDGTKEATIEVLPGMTVEFHIQTGSRTILQAILEPITNEFWVAM